jgi:hypothetical protein
VEVKGTDDYNPAIRLIVYFVAHKEKAVLVEMVGSANLSILPIVL